MIEIQQNLAASEPGNGHFRKRQQCNIDVSLRDGIDGRSNYNDGTGSPLQFS